MRGITLMSIAVAILFLAAGCDAPNQSQGRYASANRYSGYPAYAPEQPEQPRQQRQFGQPMQPGPGQATVAAVAPRPNLYPLTTPPPGAAQPMRGAAPTRIAATPEYRDPNMLDPTYARAGYGGGAGQGMDMSFLPPQDARGGMNTFTTYTPAPAYSPTPNYSAPTAQQQYARPLLSAPMPTTPIPVSAPPMPAPAPTQQFAQQPQFASMPPSAGMPVPSPSAMSLAAGYGYDGRGSGLGPYDTSIYGSSQVVGPNGQPARQTYYGRVEGTADLAAAHGIPLEPIIPVPPPSMTTPMPVMQSAPVPTQMQPQMQTQMPMQTPPAGGYTGGAYPMATGAGGVTNVPNTNNTVAAGYAPGEVRLIPAPDVPPGNHPNDAGPSQWFEIVRPGNGPLRIGRLSATCVCVGVRVPKRQIAAGERALVEARILTRPQVNNLTYGIYVNLVEPLQTVVDADVTISL